MDSEPLTFESFLRECVGRKVTIMGASVRIDEDSEVVLLLNPANVVDKPQAFAVRFNQAIPNLCLCGGVPCEL